MARRRLDDDVPRLPRGKGLALSTAEIIRIVMVAVALVAVLVLQKPCARSMGRFITSFNPPDAGVAVPDAASVAPGAGATVTTQAVEAGGTVLLQGTMTPAELEAAIARARAGQAGAPLDAGVDGR